MASVVTDGGDSLEFSSAFSLCSPSEEGARERLCARVTRSAGREVVREARVGEDGEVEVVIARDGEQ